MCNEIWKYIFAFVPYQLQVLLENAVIKKDFCFALFIVEKLKTYPFLVDDVLQKICNESQWQSAKWILTHIGKPSSQCMTLLLHFCDDDLDFLQLFRPYLTKDDFIENLNQFSNLEWILDTFHICYEEVKDEYLLYAKIQKKHFKEAKMLIERGFKLPEINDVYLLDCFFEPLHNDFIEYLKLKNLIPEHYLNLQKQRIEKQKNPGLFYQIIKYFSNLKFHIYLKKILCFGFLF